MRTVKYIETYVLHAQSLSVGSAPAKFCWKISTTWPMLLSQGEAAFGLLEVHLVPMQFLNIFQEQQTNNRSLMTIVTL